MVIQIAISPQWILFTPCLLLGWGFQGRRIKWCSFSFDQIHNAAILENSSGNISAMDHLIYSVFGVRVGFSRSVDQTALFPIGPKFNRYVGENSVRGVIRLVTIKSISC